MLGKGAGHGPVRQRCSCGSGTKGLSPLASRTLEMAGFTCLLTLLPRASFLIKAVICPNYDMWACTPTRLLAGKGRAAPWLPNCLGQLNILATQENVKRSRVGCLPTHPLTCWLTQHFPKGKERGKRLEASAPGSQSRWPTLASRIA